MSQLMRLWYLSHRRPVKAQASMRIRAVSPRTSLFAHMKHGSRRRVRQKIRHLAPLNSCTCAFEVWVYGGRKAWASSFVNLSPVEPKIANEKYHSNVAHSDVARPFWCCRRKNNKSKNTPGHHLMYQTNLSLWRWTLRYMTKSLDNKV